MNSETVRLKWSDAHSERARELCHAFLAREPEKRYIFGCNVYAAAVASQLDIAGFVDDYSQDLEFEGRPLIRTEALPADAMVLVASGGRPLTVRALLRDRNIVNVDYFSLYRWGGLDLPEAVFNEGFRTEFDNNRDKVDWIFGLLADQESRRILNRLMSFRYTYDLTNLEGFTERQTEQYFEPFFTLLADRPVFVDVGGFDGFTSEEFIRRVPDYHTIYIFEPEEANRARCSKRLSGFDKIHLFPYGAGREETTLKFSSNGSASTISDSGEHEIEIRRIDDLVKEPPTYIKMDIEGAELMALDGARNTIATHRPALAIAAYHRPSDIWNIPINILDIYQDYKVYLRHYTESIYETVMYFIPPDCEVR